MRYVQSCSRVPERDVPVITGILCESPAAEALARFQLDIEVRCVITPSILGPTGICESLKRPRWRDQFERREKIVSSRARRRERHSAN